MSLIKAIRNTLLRTGSNHLYNRDKKAAHKSAYSQTGKAIKNAKRKGRRINGSATYKKNHSAAMARANQRKSLRDQFISDW